MQSVFVAAVLATFGAVVAGCAGPGEADAADLASRFVAQANEHSRSACAMLAPASLQELEEQAGTSCAQALPALGIDGAHEVGAADVYGMDAQVDLPNQTVFLSRFDEGWKVVAAGCTTGGTDPDMPYSCLVKGR